MKTNTQKKGVVLFNPITQKAKAFSTITEASNWLSVDTSTVSRVLSGDRGMLSVKGYMAIPVA